MNDHTQTTMPVSTPVADSFPQVINYSRLRMVGFLTVSETDSKVRVVKETVPSYRILEGIH